eukprot:6303789-Amphidinium_carterae.1
MEGWSTRCFAFGTDPSRWQDATYVAHSMYGPSETFESATDYEKGEEGSEWTSKIQYGMYQT